MADLLANNVVLYGWELCVTLALFGFGSAGLRLLRYRAGSLAVRGVLGVSLLVVLGGWLNLLHLLTRPVFFTLAGTGVLLCVVEIVKTRASWMAALAELRGLRPAAKGMLALGFLVTAFLVFGYLRPLKWSHDDLQGYTVFAVKALERHSLQSDPYSERRINGSVGADIFLDTMMLAGGGLRAMPFIDSVFGLLMFVLALWAIGRRWKVLYAVLGVMLVVLPFASLQKHNLTIVYLSAASFLCLLLLKSGNGEDEPGWKEALLLGIVAGAAMTTKSTNVVFIVPYLVAAALLYRWPRVQARLLLSPVLSLLVAVVVVLPWAVGQKANQGTYYFPLLGRGYHASAYHLLPMPGAAARPATAYFLAAPMCLILLLMLAVAWRLTRQWAAWPRAAALAYLAVGAVAVPVISVGTSGEALDRYASIFFMPSFLMVGFMVLGTGLGLDAGLDTGMRRWRAAGYGVLVLAAIYIVPFEGLALAGYDDLKIPVYQAFGSVPPYAATDFLTGDLRGDEIAREAAQASRLQSVIPPGAVAIESINRPYPFDFERNTVYVADYPGMAGLPPGVPIMKGPAELRQYLLDHGIHYIFCDRTLNFRARWRTFLEEPTVSLPRKTLLFHPVTAHSTLSWIRMEAYVSDHMWGELREVALHGQVLYDDGTLIAARID
jgi:hypothetical protein